MSSEIGHRSYTLRKRAERQDETRQRIVQAIVDLHATIGPLATTVSAIAERAGVQRLTVYRYFPDQKSQLAGCGAHWNQLHPRPDPEQWLGLPPGTERLCGGLRALYAYYRESDAMIERILRDLPMLPELAEVAQLDSFFARTLEALGEGLPSGAATAAALRVAVLFASWQAMREAGLSDERAAGIMARFVEGADAGPGTTEERTT